MNTNTAEPTVSELFDLRGQTALVSGASGYLGGAMARALAEAGAAVVVSSRELARAQAVAAQLPPVEVGQHGGAALDYLDGDTLAPGFEKAVEINGGVDILVNNGNAGVGQDWKTVSYENFNLQMAMAAGYFILSRSLRDHAVEQKKPASIIMLGSMYGQVGSYPEAYEGVCPASPVAYHALKGGIGQMTRHLAVYWAAEQVRVNCLSPGPFPSEKAPAEMVGRLVEKSPMRRMGLPHEVKGAVVFFASRASSYITGHTLLVDGGWTAW